MWLYLIIFVIPVIAYFSGPAYNRNKTFLLLYMGGLALFVGLSDMLGGYDRYIYGEIFDRMADAVSNGNNYELVTSISVFEPGFSFTSYILALITENRYIYFTILTLVIYYLFYNAFKKYMTNYPLALIIFLGMVFFFTFTYLRQILAYSIAWFGVQFLIDKKRLKFLLIVIMAALIHKSGIIFAILYFLPVRKYSKFLILSVLFISTILGLTGITGALYDSFLNFSGMDMTNEYSTNNAIRIAYLIEVIFFTWIILAHYNNIEPTRINLIMLNLAWCFCITLLLFIRSSDGGRVAWYFTLGLIYIVSYITTTTSYIKRRRSFLGTFITVVMLFLFLRIYIAWQNYNFLYPYKTFLTDGYREEDNIWRSYEYDHNYDNNKFYRPAFRLKKK